MSKKYCRIFVAPEFKSFIKTQAATEGISIIELTRKLSRKSIKGEKEINSLWSRLI
jgi:hypothetical protein